MSRNGRAIDVVGDKADDRVRDLRDRVLADVRKLRSLDLSILEAEILDSLIGGRKNISELVEYIYHERPSDVGFNASRLKVRRALRELERRGIVSTRLFGRDKPYRITRHGVAILASISPDMGRYRAVHPVELGLVGVATLVGLLMWLNSHGFLGERGWGSSQGLFAVFFTLFGLSLGVLIHVIRRFI